MNNMNLTAANQNFPAFDRLNELGVFDDIDTMFPELPFTPAEQARRMADLKRRYEDAFPESKAGVRQGLGAQRVHGKTSGQQPAPAFTTLVVERAAGRRGWSKSTVKQVIRRGERIKREVLDAIIEDGGARDEIDLLDLLVEYGQPEQMSVYAAWKNEEPPPKATAMPRAPRALAQGWWQSVPGYANEPDRFTVPGYVDLRLGDSEKLLQTFNAGSFDAIISDEPYGVDYKDDKGEGIDNDEDPEPIASWSVPAMVRVLRPDSFMVLHGVFKPVSGDREVMEVWRSHLLRARCPLRDVAVWDKVSPSHRGGYLRHQHELVWICTKGSPRRQTWSDIWGLVHDERGRLVGKEHDADLWSIPKPMSGLEAAHRTAKPIELHMREMLGFSPPGGNICDPFMGSGPTAVAALRTGRSYVGIELKRDWFVLAVERVVDELSRMRPALSAAA